MFLKVLKNFKTLISAKKTLVRHRRPIIQALWKLLLRIIIRHPRIPKMVVFAVYLTYVGLTGRGLPTTGWSDSKDNGAAHAFLPIHTHTEPSLCIRAATLNLGHWLTLPPWVENVAVVKSPFQWIYLFFFLCVSTTLCICYDFNVCNKC